MDNTEYELEYCTVCYQMTNHLDGICQKCKISKELIKKINGASSDIVHIIIIATKPDIIKQAPLYKELTDNGECVLICHIVKCIKRGII